MNIEEEERKGQERGLRKTHKEQVDKALEALEEGNITKAKVILETESRVEEKEIQELYK